MKVYGPGIFCSECHAEPFPDDPAVRETFDLMRGADGEWRCELHRAPEDKRVAAEADQPSENPTT
jgi:hypothetical protein